jgi:hypothetical protein
VCSPLCPSELQDVMWALGVPTREIEQESCFQVYLALCIISSLWRGFTLVTLSSGDYCGNVGQMSSLGNVICSSKW